MGSRTPEVTPRSQKVLIAQEATATSSPPKILLRIGRRVTPTLQVSRYQLKLPLGRPCGAEWTVMSLRRFHLLPFPITRVLPAAARRGKGGPEADPAGTRSALSRDQGSRDTARGGERGRPLPQTTAATQTPPAPRRRSHEPEPRRELRRHWWRSRTVPPAERTVDRPAAKVRTGPTHASVGTAFSRFALIHAWTSSRR
jgi:hypothetical protein